jgi:hypothetical protein
MVRDIYSPEEFFWGWPKRSILSIYDSCGELRARKKAEKFDLSNEACGGWSVTVPLMVHFGVQRREKEIALWDEDQIRKCEDNIEYDLSFDSYKVIISRVKGISLKMSEEALWRLDIDVI